MSNLTTLDNFLKIFSDITTQRIGLPFSLSHKLTYVYYNNENSVDKTNECLFQKVKRFLINWDDKKWPDALVITEGQFWPGELYFRAKFICKIITFLTNLFR